MPSSPKQSHNDTSCPGQRQVVQEPGPFGEQSIPDSTVVGWSFATEEGRVTEYTLTHVFHKPDEQPYFAFSEDGSMRSGHPSTWRRYSDSALVDGVGEKRSQIVRSDGWSMVDPDEWAREMADLPAESAIEEDLHGCSASGKISPAGSESKEDPEGAGTESISPAVADSKEIERPRAPSPLVVHSSWAKSPVQKPAEKDKKKDEDDAKFFESLLSKKKREDHDRTFFRSLLAKTSPWVGVESSMAHPLVFDPNSRWDMLPHKILT